MYEYGLETIFVKRIKPIRKQKKDRDAKNIPGAFGDLL